jgi:hypothetical protein
LRLNVAGGEPVGSAPDDVTRNREGGDSMAQVPNVADLRKEAKYERRVVIFYDVLGWRAHIQRAGERSEDINLLRRVALKMVRAPQMKRDFDLRVSTFSDNVVLSQRPDPATTPMLLQQLGIWQLGAAISGFLLRGGVTIGDIIHEDEIVFGPGLNRAYHLQDRVAIYPRFVVDTDCLAEYGNLGSLCATENRIHFIDPFRLAFCQHLRSAKYESSEALATAGLPEPRDVFKDISNERILALICHSLEEQIKGPVMDDRAFVKIEWLYDRIGKQIHLGPATALRPKKPRSP